MLLSSALLAYAVDAEARWRASAKPLQAGTGSGAGAGTGSCVARRRLFRLRPQIRRRADERVVDERSPPGVREPSVHERAGLRRPAGRFGDRLASLEGGRTNRPNTRSRVARSSRHGRPVSASPTRARLAIIAPRA